MFAIGLLVLLLQSSPANGPTYYVTDFSYDRLDCESGKKLSKESVPAGTLVSIESKAEKRLRVLEIASGRESCIKAGEKDLVPVQPVVLPDGSVAEFVDARYHLDPPRVQAPASRAVLSLGISDSPDTTLPDAIVMFAIGANGSVSGCRVLRSSRSTGWDNWAMDVACNAKYLPARKNGVPIAVTIVQRVSVGRS